MNDTATKEISKFLSLVLRHKPEAIQLKLDENGWADVNELISQSNMFNKQLDVELLIHIVETNDKKRFAFNDDKTKIRASQGHSITVELNLKAEIPLDFLYHGTVEKNIKSIKEQGLQKMSRQQVHLSKDKETAIKVGNRRGKAIVLVIHAKQMHEDGFVFHLSENQVWLTDHVPAKYIQF